MKIFNSPQTECTEISCRHSRINQVVMFVTLYSKILFVKETNYAQFAELSVLSPIVRKIAIYMQTNAHARLHIFTVLTFPLSLQCMLHFCRYTLIFSMIKACKF